MSEKVTRVPLSVRDFRHAMRIQVKGAQASDLPVYFTKSKFTKYEGAAADVNPDCSGFYARYGIQVQAALGAETKPVTVQISVDGTSWEVPPARFSSDLETDLTPGVIGAGEIYYLTLPVAGTRVRLLVDQPGVLTDFIITVLMDCSSELFRAIGKF